ncbi:MAG: ergothioneine biosynthesis protein EgtB [Actinobacteria bacterium]|nr:ergothioneine biosynthesis protein EgtB [Actinomycetota bacterium]
MSVSDSGATPCELSVADLQQVRDLTEKLASPLSPEDQTVQSMPDASPTKWHRAHTTWFFETFLLEPHLSDYRLYNVEFPYLFNSYYEAVGSRHPRHERGLISRPGTAEIAHYRGHVDEALQRLTESELSLELSDLLILGMHHEQQHQELLCMDALHMLSRHPFRPAYCDHAEDTRKDEPRPQRWLQHEGGLATIGQRHSAPTAQKQFCFDNETPQHQVHLEPFQISDRLITCSEWLEFIDDGGYQRSDLWMSEGWAALAKSEQSAPRYWNRVDARWKVFGLAGERALNLEQPVTNVSWFEADAFARWSDARLPTEAEWELAAGSPPPGAHLNLDVLAPRSAATSPDSQQWFGEVWQWTESSYRPYPGYRPPRGAIGEYNGKFMMNQQVLRGSSYATPAGHARKTYRNFFAPSSNWMFSGLRLARDI